MAGMWWEWMRETVGTRREDEGSVVGMDEGTAGTRRGDGGNVVGMDEGDSRNKERRWWECGGNG